MIRKISAHYIFPGNALPLKRGIISINELGEIVDLTDTAGNLQEQSNLEFYDGIITPGFVNCHTHLELSKLKGQINKHTGLINFIKQVLQLRRPCVFSASIERSDAEMHNTYSSSQDLDEIKDLKEKIIFVLCPNANLYIENHLPDIEMLRNSGHLITLGTDSPASKIKLSILEEMKTIQQHFPTISLRELIDWGTINGAIALGFDKQLGSIRKGKKPGLNLISNINFTEMKFTAQSNVKVI